MRKRSLVIVWGLVMAGLFVGASSGQAGGVATTYCKGTLASGGYGRIVVPAGASCDGTSAKIYVSDGIWVKPGATFVLGQENGASTGVIHGGVHAKSPSS